MSSVAHEVVVQVLREQGVLAEVLRRARGIEVGAVAPADPNLSEVKSTEWHGDALFTKGDPKAPERWLMLEAQLSVDPEKLRTIPLGLELARDRFRGADGDVVLVTVGTKVARWFDRHPFIFRGSLGTRRSLAVIRVDLARLPVGKLLDAERPSLALLAAAAHARGPRAKARRVAERALRVARKGGGPLAPALVDVILQVVDARLRQELEEVMERQGFRTDWLQDAYLRGKTEGKTEGEVEGEARGEAKAARRALARVLSRRGIALTARQQARIEAEESVKRLEGWLDAAVTATELAEVFTDAPPSPGSRRRAAGASRSARAGEARARGARSRTRASSSR
jgi:hypothetical protein